MDRRARKELARFIVRLERAIAEAEADAAIGVDELDRMRRDLIDLRRVADRLGTRPAE
jgi:hypothetical protein